MAHWPSWVFFFYFHRRSSPLFSILLQSHSTKDSWLLGEIQTLNGDDLSREHLAALFPWHFLCVKALLKCEKGKIWKYWLLDWCISLLNQTLTCVKCLVHLLFYREHIPLTEVTWISLFQLLHYLHHVPSLLPGVGQRCQVRGCNVIPRIVQRSLEGMFTLTVTLQPNMIFSTTYETANMMSSFFPQGRPLSFKTFLIWVLISIYQGKE